MSKPGGSQRRTGAGYPFSKGTVNIMLFGRIFSLRRSRTIALSSQVNSTRLFCEKIQVYSEISWIIQLTSIVHLSWPNMHWWNVERELFIPKGQQCMWRRVHWWRSMWWWGRSRRGWRWRWPRCSGRHPAAEYCSWGIQRALPTRAPAIATVHRPPCACSN